MHVHVLYMYLIVHIYAARFVAVLWFLKSYLKKSGGNGIKQGFSTCNVQAKCNKRRFIERKL